MVRKDILSGLKNAISKGESLKDAMMSFYRAGYSKEKIEEAAREIQSEQRRERMAMTHQEVKESKSKKNTKPIASKPINKPISSKSPPQKVSQYIPEKKEIKPQVVQKPKKPISNYSSDEKESKLGWIILIGGTLVIIAAIALIVIFRTQVTVFLNNLFG